MSLGPKINSVLPAENGQCRVRKETSQAQSDHKLNRQGAELSICLSIYLQLLFTSYPDASPSLIFPPLSATEATPRRYLFLFRCECKPQRDDHNSNQKLEADHCEYFLLLYSPYSGTFKMIMTPFLGAQRRGGVSLFCYFIPNLVPRATPHAILKAEMTLGTRLFHAANRKTKRVVP